MESISSYLGPPIAAVFLLAIFCKRVNEQVSENWETFPAGMRKMYFFTGREIHSFHPSFTTQGPSNFNCGQPQFLIVTKVWKHIVHTHGTDFISLTKYYYIHGTVLRNTSFEVRLPGSIPGPAT